MCSCEGGELSLDNEYDEETVVDIMCQIGMGVQYMHKLGIIHRDLKLPNILCKNKDNFNVIKITDFGMCQPL